MPIDLEELQSKLTDTISSAATGMLYPASKKGKTWKFREKLVFLA